MGWIERVGHRWVLLISLKNCWTFKGGVGRCARKSPIMEWANVLKESSKKFTEAECSLSQQRQLAHWCRWVSSTLTQRGKPVLQGPALQEIIAVFGSPLVYALWYSVCCAVLCVPVAVLRPPVCTSSPHLFHSFPEPPRLAALRTFSVSVILFLFNLFILLFRFNYWYICFLFLFLICRERGK